jgi:hypothetical protein
MLAEGAQCVLRGWPFAATGEVLRPITEELEFYLGIYLADGTIVIKQPVSHAVPRVAYGAIANGLKFAA